MLDALVGPDHLAEEAPGTREPALEALASRARQVNGGQPGTRPAARQDDLARGVTTLFGAGVAALLLDADGRFLSPDETPRPPEPGAWRTDAGEPVPLRAPADATLFFTPFGPITVLDRPTDQ